MITAAEALALPSAKLSSSDAEAAAKYLLEIEAFIRAGNVTRVGCTMPVDPRRLNPVIAAEIERALRVAGWRAEFQKVVQASALAPGEKIHVFQLALAFPDDAYALADARELAGRLGS